MQEPTNRGNNKTALIVLKVLLGLGLFSLLMCAGVVFFAWSVCNSMTRKAELPHHGAPVVYEVRGSPAGADGVLPARLPA